MKHSDTDMNDYEKGKEYMKATTIEELEYMKSNVTFGKNPNMEMPYNQILMGYGEALDQAILKIKGINI